MADRHERAGRRPLWIVVAALLLGAAALWGSSRAVWSRTPVDGGVRGTVEQTVLGADLAPALPALALLAVAGVAGMIATGGWPRRLLGAVLVMTGAAGAALAVLAIVDGADPRPGHALALLGGLLVAAGGAVGIGSARRMPRLGARYRNPRAREAAADPDERLWKALSEGDDPTFEG